MYCHLVQSNLFNNCISTCVFEFHFLVPPLIRIRQQIIGIANGSTATLECEVEAFPEAIRYWERSDGRLIEIGDKYKTEILEQNGYRSKMQLNITRMHINDYGLYHCIAKNEIGITRGVINLHGE